MSASNKYHDNDNDNDNDRMIIFRKEKEKVWTTTPSCSLPRRPFQNMTSMSLAPSIKRFKHDHHICKAYRYIDICDGSAKSKLIFSQLCGLILAQCQKVESLVPTSNSILTLEGGSLH